MGERAVLGSSKRHCLHFLHSLLSSWQVVQTMPTPMAIAALQKRANLHSDGISSHSIKGNEYAKDHLPNDQSTSFVPVPTKFVVESVLKCKAKALLELSEVLFNEPLTVVVRGLRDALGVVPDPLLDVAV